MFVKKYMRKLLTALLIRSSGRGKVNVLLFTKTSIYNHAIIYKPETLFNPVTTRCFIETACLK